MKKLEWVFALILTVAITLSIAETINKNTRLKSTEIRLNDTQTKISALERVQLPKTEIKPILDELKALTRENENLRQEVADLKNQCREFGWLKEPQK